VDTGVLAWREGLRYLVVDGGHLLFGGWDAHEVVAEHAADLAIARLKEQIPW
jgi:hypothetical protein